MIPAACSAIEQKLKDATASYHDLMMGRAVRVLVDQNGERIEYQSSNKNQLAAYIEQLQSQLDDCLSGTPTDRVKGPMRFFY